MPPRFWRNAGRGRQTAELENQGVVAISEADRNSSANRAPGCECLPPKVAGRVRTNNPRKHSKRDSIDSHKRPARHALSLVDLRLELMARRHVRRNLKAKSPADRRRGRRSCLQTQSLQLSNGC